MPTTTDNVLDDPQVDPFEIASQAATEIAERTGVASHDIALTLGSGWAKAADLIGVTTATVPAS
jgi:purine-nucleoside phosphorylase